MPEFQYNGIDKIDGDTKGVIVADEPYLAIEELKARGISVHSLVRARDSQPAVRKRSLSRDDINSLFEHLHEITRARLPIPTALASYSANAETVAVGEAMLELASEIEKGASLSDALANLSSPISPIHISLIRAGEASGNLSGVLGDLLLHTKELQEIRAGLQEALVYPFIVLNAAFLLFSFLCVFISPTFMRIFSELGASPPFLMDIFNRFGHLITTNSFTVIAYFCIAIAVPLVMLYAIRRHARKADSVQHILFRIPIIGPLYRLALITRFARTLSILLASRVELHDALTLAASATDSRSVELMAHEAAQEALSGENLRKSIEHITVLRAKDMWMLVRGGETGQLEKAAKRLQESCSSEFKRSSRKLLQLTGPVAISLVGVLVLILAIAVLIPVFSMPGLGYR